MLILSRKDNESFFINDNIEVIVLDKKNGKTRLGIKAPPEILVNRKEVLDKINKAKSKNSAA